MCCDNYAWLLPSMSPKYPLGRGYTESWTGARARARACASTGLTLASARARARSFWLAWLDLGLPPKKEGERIGLCAR